jgi:hypothetical protein
VGWDGRPPARATYHAAKSGRDRESREEKKRRKKGKDMRPEGGGRARGVTPACKPAAPDVVHALPPSRLLLLACSAIIPSSSAARIERIRLRFVGLKKE